MKDRTAYSVLSLPFQIWDCEEPILYDYGKKKFWHYLKKI